MNIINIIEKKRDRGELTKEEIEYFVNEYTAGNIEDYQASSLLMAIYLNGMTIEETTNLTIAMANSSKVIDFGNIFNNEYVLDKHSTGGIGDKITLIVIPIVASLDVKVFKMSGRGLGFTGGTADKLESIDGYKVEQDVDKSIRQVGEIGASIISQSSDLALADKKLYALRDVTGTVSCIPLIASSIMSKKIASGVDKIVLEVTVGTGAFMKDLKSARNLASAMVEIGNLAGKETIAVITNMDEPIGSKVGNSLEIEEVVEFLLSDKEALKSKVFSSIAEVVYEISANMLKLSGITESITEAKVLVEKAILDRSAYNKFIQIVKAQGGYLTNQYLEGIDETIDLPVISSKAEYMKEIKADKDGYVNIKNAEKIGTALVELGGGRHKKTDSIDLAVGFKFAKKIGDEVIKGDTIVYVYFNDKDKFNRSMQELLPVIRIENIKPVIKPNIIEIIK